MTNMQLQKLVYIAHGYSLALMDGPLIRNNVHAFQYGPVYPKLYKKLSKYGSGFVTETVKAEDRIDPTGKAFGLIEAIWNIYGQMSGSKLSTLTHMDGTPWSQVWEKCQFAPIPDEIIREHYQSKVSEDVTGVQ